MKSKVEELFQQALLVICFMMCVTPVVIAQTKTTTKKPLNIVLFVADDLTASDIEPYGSRFVRTPNLAQFSSQSLVFNKAFSGSSTCTPARSTMLTGLMPLRHGAHGNHSGVTAGTKSIVQYLKPLGYRVAIAGKYHIGPEDIFDFERVSKTNVPEPGHEERPGLNYDLAMEPVDKWLAQQSKQKPFMLVVADHSPHVIWPEKAAYSPDSIDVPAKHIDTRETRASRARYYTDISKMDTNFGKLLASLEKNGLSENTLVIFTADQGAQWPFAKWSLYDDGVKVPLIIRAAGKTKTGTRSDALVSLADLVPTLVQFAGGNAPRDIDGKSFLPVINDPASAHHQYVFATHTGDKLMNRSPMRMVRTAQFKYILNLAPQILYTTHMDRAKDHDGGREYWPSWRARSFYDGNAANILWRYHHRPEEELYDVIADPGEQHNLATDPKFLSTLEQLRQELKQWRGTQQDTITGPEIIKDEPKGTKPIAPYVFLD